MTYRIGQKVVCFTTFEALDPDERGPVAGVVYTIRGIVDDPEAVYLLLEEIVNAPKFYEGDVFGEVAWFSPCFRPVKTTDIGIFTAMLAPTKIGAPA